MYIVVQQPSPAYNNIVMVKLRSLTSSLPTASLLLIYLLRLFSNVSFLRVDVLIYNWMIKFHWKNIIDVIMWVLAISWCETLFICVLLFSLRTTGTRHSLALQRSLSEVAHA